MNQFSFRFHRFLFLLWTDYHLLLRVVPRISVLDHFQFCLSDDGGNLSVLYKLYIGFPENGHDHYVFQQYNLYTLVFHNVCSNIQKLFRYMVRTKKMIQHCLIIWCQGWYSLPSVSSTYFALFG